MLLQVALPLLQVALAPLPTADSQNAVLPLSPIPSECHHRFADPGYYEGDPEEDGAPDPMAAALPNKEAYQNIRALPAAPGSALLFTHRCSPGPARDAAAGYSRVY